MQLPRTYVTIILLQIPSENNTDPNSHYCILVVIPTIKLEVIFNTAQTKHTP